MSSSLILCFLAATATATPTVTLNSRSDKVQRKIEIKSETPLMALLNRYASSREVDTALLHFQNGLMIPLPLREHDVVSRLDPVLVPGPNGVSLRVRESRQPYLALADSLVTVELVDRQRYEGQFTVNDSAQVGAGAKLFSTHCQYCHGVHHTGATYALDLVDALPRSTLESANQLYHHVAFEDRFPPWKQRMPVLSFVTYEEAKLLWSWLSAVQGSQLRRY